MVLRCSTWLLLGIIISGTQGVNWNGNNWAFACDFVGNDLSNVRSTGEQCGGKCAATPGCTHFAWTGFNGGTCWLKGGKVSRANAIDRGDRSNVCGIVVGEGGGGTSTGGIDWNGNNWALGCNFVNRDLSNAQSRGEECGGKCAATAGCTHFTWTGFNGGTCWMKSGSVSKNDAVATSDKSSVCGVINSGPDWPTTGTTAAFNGYRPNHAAKYDYKTALSYSLLFYEAQRSGKLPSDNRIKWRGDSALADLIQGGYYDAGDRVKFGFPMAGAATIIAWSAISFPTGYSLAGQTAWAARCIKWFTDYFIAAHTSATTLVGQIGDGHIDHAFWGRPEQMTMSRPAFSITASAPGSDLAGETAAALAAASIFFRSQGDSSYADSCLMHARQLLDFADKFRGIYSQSISNAGSFYLSSGYNDELVWAAAWVAKASGRADDMTRAVSLYNALGGPGNTPQIVSWDDKWAMVHLLMYDITRGATFLAKVNTFVSYVLTLPKTPKGLVWSAVSEWGSLRYATNYAMLMLQAARLGIQEKACVDFAESQLNYALGDTGHSFVVGFGLNPPVRPHHAGASCGNMPAKCDWSNLDSPNPSPQVLYGALVGGPDRQDNWSDVRKDYKTNEVAVDYNAGFQGALAGIIQRFY